METPLSIQVIPQQIIQEQKAINMDRALSNVSGVYSAGGEGGQESITMRGFFTTTTFRNGFKVEEYSPTGGGTVGAVSFANIESIEVMKGPAATLYGLVEPGGMVNVVTKQPKDYTYGSIEQSIGSWNHYLTSLDISGPFDKDKKFLYRLNASYDTSKSWRNGVDSKVQFFAPVFEWRMTPDTTLTLEGQIRNARNNQDVGQLTAYDSASNTLIFPPRKLQILTNPTTFKNKSGKIRLKHNFNENWKLSVQFVDNETVVPAQPVWYPTALHKTANIWYVDRGLNSFGTTNRTNAAISDLTGKFKTGNIQHTLLFGGDYYYEKFVFGMANSPYGQVSTTPLLNPTPPTGLAIDPNTQIWFYQLNKSYGIHLQDQIEFPNNVFVLAGLRYQNFKTRSDLGIPGLGRMNGDFSSDDAVTPRLGVLWRAHKWLSLYANYSENFGVNNGFDYQGNALPPEKAKEGEVGAKFEFYDGKLTSSFALYDLTKFNVAVGDPAHPNFKQTIGEINSKGLELDVQGKISPNINIVANASYTNAKVTKSTSGSSYIEGNRLNNVPLYLANIWAIYDFSPEKNTGWRIGGGINYHGSSRTTQGGIPTLEIPSYTDASIMAAYDMMIGGKPTTFQVNVNNLFDEEYYNNLYVVAYANYSYVNYSTPRQITASLKVTF